MEIFEEKRITYSPGYLLAVGVMAIANMVLFWIMVEQLAERMRVTGVGSARGILSVFFGLIFAAGCNLTALTLARWANRNTFWDNVLLFILIELVGLALFALGSPYVASAIAG